MWKKMTSSLCYVPSPGFCDRGEGRHRGVVGRHVWEVFKDVRHQESHTLSFIQRFLFSTFIWLSLKHQCPWCHLSFDLRFASGGQSVHQGHHTGPRSHPAGDKEWRDPGDWQERTNGGAGPGLTQRFKHHAESYIRPSRNKIYRTWNTMQHQ